MTSTLQRNKPGKVGRPKGYSPGLQRKITDQCADWAWDTEKLNKKIESRSQDQCSIWRGSQGPYGNLFGAYKNGQAQMTQANRIIYMDRTKEDITEYQIVMRCHNRYCCNFDHMIKQEGNRRL